MLENLECLRRPNLRFFRDRLFVVIAFPRFVLCPEFKTCFANCWLRITTSTMSDFASLVLSKGIVFIFGRIGLTDILLLTQTPDEFEALLAVANGKSVSQLFGLVKYYVNIA
jgi:hypothetical protein